jgi:hypothetical protein
LAITAWSDRVAERTPSPPQCAGAASSGLIARISHSTAEWLKKIQQPDGSTPVTERMLRPGWATAYALLSWSRMKGYDAERKHAREWLLGTRGHTFAQTVENGNLLGHDPSLTGWPWVSGTHSWIEPTSLAILALRREGLATHPRVTEGTSVIIDRAIHSGGWNYGNKSVYGKALRPQPGPTGMALLALANQGLAPRIISSAIDYLRETLPHIQAPVSMSWGVLGLRAHGACPKEARVWLASTLDRTIKRPDAAMSLALLLLADHEQGVSLLLSPPTEQAIKRENSTKPHQPLSGPTS